MNLSFTGKTSLLNNQGNPKKKPQKEKKIKISKLWLQGTFLFLLL
jgi:hypothetical protein